jgi:alpha,alpha-trehalose phosphorylase
LRFDPRLPVRWSSLTFRVTQRGNRLRVRVSQDEIAFRVEEGEGLTVDVRGERYAVTRHHDVIVKLDHHGPRHSKGPSADDIQGAVRDDGSVITASLPANVAGADSGVPVSGGEPSP